MTTEWLDNSDMSSAYFTHMHANCMGTLFPTFGSIQLPSTGNNDKERSCINKDGGQNE